VPLRVYVGLYLLALRHPITVARQLATIAQLAPGRLTLGVGLGGEDRHEVEICGVDPKTRGRRMDESLRILRRLADGTPVTVDGEFFAVDDALILPAPSPSIPLIVGGRSDAAISRAAKLGDGWLGIWVSPRRYAAVRDHITCQAADAGRDPGQFEHALNVWCGFATTRDAARELVATQMQRFYQNAFRAVRALLAVRDAGTRRRVLAPVHRRGLFDLQRDPVRSRRRRRDRCSGELRRLLTASAPTKEIDDCVFRDVRFRQPRRGAGRTVAGDARAMFERMAGLRNKVFTLDEKNHRARNVYVWDTEQAARQFFSIS